MTDKKKYIIFYEDDKGVSLPSLLREFSQECLTNISEVWGLRDDVNEEEQLLSDAIDHSFSNAMILEVTLNSSLKERLMASPSFREQAKDLMNEQRENDSRREEEKEERKKRDRNILLQKYTKLYEQFGGLPPSECLND